MSNGTEWSDYCLCKSVYGITKQSATTQQEANIIWDMSSLDGMLEQFSDGPLSQWIFLSPFGKFNFISLLLFMVIGVPANLFLLLVTDWLIISEMNCKKFLRGYQRYKIILGGLINSVNRYSALINGPLHLYWSLTWLLPTCYYYWSHH